MVEIQALAKNAGGLYVEFRVTSPYPDIFSQRQRCMETVLLVTKS